MSNETKVDSINIMICGKKTELTIEQAKKLNESLNEIFNIQPTYIQPDYPLQQPYYPTIEPYPLRYTYTTSSGTTNSEHQI